MATSLALEGEYRFRVRDSSDRAAAADHRRRVRLRPTALPRERDCRWCDRPARCRHRVGHETQRRLPLVHGCAAGCDAHRRLRGDGYHHGAHAAVNCSTCRGNDAHYLPPRSRPDDARLAFCPPLFPHAAFARCTLHSSVAPLPTVGLCLLPQPCRTLAAALRCGPRCGGHGALPDACARRRGGVAWHG